MASPHPRRYRIKRIVDLLLALAGVFAALPCMLAVAAAVRIDSPGPVLFRQERLGLHRRPFRVLKFRTMRVDAERETGPVWSWNGDPRVTRVGRVLRALHLDELPQLWNVLAGEMSFVGPRPEREHFVEQFERVIPGYAERFLSLPGITGLGQIRSGYDQSIRTVRRKIRYDRLYVRAACPLLDARILAETAARVTGLAGVARYWTDSLEPVFRRGQLGTWSRSVRPQSNADHALARGSLRRFATRTPGPAAAGRG